MIDFDSDEYWLCKTWDRFREIDRVPDVVKKEFLHQEQLVISAVAERLIIFGVSLEPLHIIDLCCGTGRVAKLLLDHFGERVHITLVDFNAETLKTAQRNLNGKDNIDFIQASFYSVERIIEQGCDVIMCVDILHHVSRLELLIQSIAGALNAGGMLVGNTFVRDLYTQWDRLKYGRLKSWRRRSLNWLAKTIYSFCTSRCKSLIRKLGLARIEPVDEGYIKALLEKYFEKVRYEKEYYLWFCAERPRLQ